MQTRTVFTNVTPLPRSLSERVAVRTLHDHDAMIKQNPLIIHYQRCATPKDASQEDINGIWYELTDRVSYLPWGLLQGKVRYRGCFHDTPDGLRTHIYAPMGVTIRNHWTVQRRRGEPSYAGESPPPDALYLQEEIELRCPFGTTSFVRRTLSQAHRELVERLAEAGRG